jgi:hypothetical protein
MVFVQLAIITVLAVTGGWYFTQYSGSEFEVDESDLMSIYHSNPDDQFTVKDVFVRKDVNFLQGLQYLPH